MKKNLLILLVFILFAGTKELYSQGVVVNEVLASNSTVNTDEDGDYQDWVELYNNSAEPVNLNGYGLSDNPNNLFKWVFPDVTIDAGGYMLIWCSNKNRTNPDAPLHTNFAISADGEVISLTHPDGTVVDFAPATPMMANISFGRSPNGTGDFVFFETPTPNAENIGTGIPEALNPPTFSQDSGFFTEGFELTISSEYEDAVILYTLDGSEPNENNLEGTTYSYKNQYPRLPGQPFGEFLTHSYQTLEYSGPINIVDRTPEPNKVTAISTTYDFEPNYFPDGPIFKGNVVRARVVKPGFTPSPVVTRNYFVTPEGSNHFSLPIISISTNEDRLFEYYNGIHVAGIDFDTWRTNNPNQVPDWEIGNFARRGITAERVANLSFFVDGNEVVNNNVGIRIRGNYSRLYASKAFNIYSRTEYGDSKIDYPLFNDQPHYLSYERLSLKSSSGDQRHTLFRDPLNHELTKGLRLETEAYRPVLTFINGEYWGIQSLREKYDDKYFKRVYNINGDELDVLEDNAVVEEGDAEHYLQMRSFIQNNSLAISENYEYIQTQMDTDSFQDYFISNIYLQNVDWPGNNIVYWRKKTAAYQPDAPYGHDGRWRWAIHDMDSTFGISGGNNYINSLADATLEGGTSWPNPDWSTLILRRLLENETFKNEFINRFADLMNSYFHSDRVVSKINEMKTVIEAEVPYHIFRWKGPSSISSWNYFLNRQIGFANERPEFQREHIREKFEIESDITAILDVSDDTHGYVKMNTIDITPETPGIPQNPYPWTGIYFHNIPVTVKAIALPGYEFSHWTGSVSGTDAEITFTPDADFSLTAHFTEAEPVEAATPIYFWMMDGNVPNDTPMTSILSSFEAGSSDGVIGYESCFEGYPFANGHPNWRKGSMERRNSPTEINYMPEANNDLPFASSNMRGLQIRQPFQIGSLENTMTFSFSTQGYKDIVFGFAAKDEGAADAILIDYSVDGGSSWSTTGLPNSNSPLSSDYQLFEYDFSEIEAVNNIADFKIRLRFDGQDMTVDNGDRVTFNNFSVSGVAMELSVEIENPALEFSVYPNPANDFIGIYHTYSDVSYQMYAIDGRMVKSGKLNDTKIMINDLQNGVYLLQLHADNKTSVKKIVKR